MAIAKKKLAEPVRIDIKREDTVKVISGRDKGKTGRVLGVNRQTGKKQPVPRHSEIDELLAKHILRYLGLD